MLPAKNLRLVMGAVLVLGVVLVLMGLGRRTVSCPAPKTVYKYVPRSPEEERDNPVDVEDVFRAMFSEPSPWVGTFRSNERKKGG
jgi:hypothetical protein